MTQHSVVMPMGKKEMACVRDKPRKKLAMSASKTGLPYNPKPKLTPRPILFVIAIQANC